MGCLAIRLLKPNCENILSNGLRLICLDPPFAVSSFYELGLKDDQIELGLDAENPFEAAVVALERFVCEVVGFYFLGAADSVEVFLT